MYRFTIRKIWIFALVAALSIPTGLLLAQDDSGLDDMDMAPIASEDTELLGEDGLPLLEEEDLLGEDSLTPAADTPVAAEEEVTVEEESSGLFGQVLKYYRVGKWVMHFLLVLSIASLTVILERFWAYKNAKMDVVAFINEFRSTLLKDRDVKKALAVCDAQAHKPVANVVKSALLRFDEPSEELEKILENAAISEVGRLEKFLPLLATVANVAPMFGFLGTVTGMIGSFDAIAKYGMTNPNLVAQGISEALVTTAAGLIVALFTQPFYNYYSSVVTQFLRQMEGASNVLLETHAELRK